MYRSSGMPRAPHTRSTSLLQGLQRVEAPTGDNGRLHPALADPPAESGDGNSEPGCGLGRREEVFHTARVIPRSYRAVALDFLGT